MAVPAPAGVSASGRSPYWPNDKANGVVQGTLAAVAASPPFAFVGPLNLFLWAEFTTSLTTSAGSLSADVGAAGVLAAGTSINSTLVPPGTTMSAIGGGGGVTVTLVLPTYTYWGKTKTNVAQITDLVSTDYLLGAAVAGYGVPAGTVVSSIDVTALPPVPASGYPGRTGTITISNAITADPGLDITSPFTFALDDGIIATGVDAAATFTGAAIVYNGTPQLERSFDGGSTWLPCNIGGSGILAQWPTATTGGVPVSMAFGEPEQYMLYRVNMLAYTGIGDTTFNYRLSETGQAARSLSIPTL